MTPERVLRCEFEDNTLKVMNYAYILWCHSQYRPGTEMHVKIALVPLYFLLYHHSWVTQLVIVDSPWHSSWFSSSKNYWAFVNSLTKHITTSSVFFVCIEYKRNHMFPLLDNSIQMVVPHPNTTTEYLSLLRQASHGPWEDLGKVFLIVQEVFVF